MNIQKNAYVALTYELHTDGHDGPLVEKCDASRPLGFVFGAGRMLPAFEAALEGMEAGQTFEFSLSPDDAYGRREPDAIVDIPKSVFVGPDGQLREDLMQLGARVPMSDSEGRRMIGIVIEVSDQAVKMDFNHPMADETLFFRGEVIEVRDATVDELLGSQSHGCGGCDGGSCGGGCGSCDSDDEGEGGCGGCGCH